MPVLAGSLYLIGDLLEQGLVQLLPQCVQLKFQRAAEAPALPLATSLRFCLCFRLRFRKQLHRVADLSQCCTYAWTPKEPAHPVPVYHGSHQMAPRRKRGRHDDWYRWW